MKHIPLSIPNVGEKEQAYVNEAIASGWISSVGSFVGRFEKELAAYAKQEDAVVVTSGTAGLHLACEEAGIGQGDLVLCPSLTFIASVNPIRYCNADPLFLDVDDSFCIDPLKLKSFLRRDCKVVDHVTIHVPSGRIIRAIVIVHIFGNMANMPLIMDALQSYPMTVIEDAAEAIGSFYREGKYAGKMAGTIGDFGVYSFNGNKIISTGGGGCVLSKHTDALKHIRYRSTQAKDDALYFVHHEVGYNYRLTNIQAAIGCAQLEQLEDFIAHKKELYQVYLGIFTKAGIEMMPFRPEIRSNHWFFTILWEDTFGLSRHDLMMALKEQGIEVRPVWSLIHEQKPYLNSICDDLTCSLYYKTRIINVPCSSNLSIKEAQHVADTIVSLKQGV